MARWFLEGFLEPSRTLNRIAVNAFPFVVGRVEGLPLTLHGASISRRHAQLIEQDGTLLLQDLGSTNGTFLNRKRLEQISPLCDGDIIHIGDYEFRVVDELAVLEPPDPDMTMVKQPMLAQRLAAGTRELREMLEQELVIAVFQPIISSNGKIVAYEALGRGKHPALPPGPVQLFDIAADIGQTVALSRVFRQVALKAALQNNILEPVFLNTHPDEVKAPEALIQDFAALRAQFPTLTLMMELAHAPPEVVKFDIAFIRGIDKAPPQQVELLRMLVEMVGHMGVQSLAEGVGEAAEASICETLPFNLYQGFHYARPDLLEILLTHTPDTLVHRRVV
jgi:EAL domain-containing protein (putative c-di-GMP-specific phosphodiesterase class I)